MALPGIFEQTLFEPPKVALRPVSRFIKPIHPKTMIAPEEAAISKVIAAGWWGQPKVHGHRAQIHIPAGQGRILVYNRQGQIHKEILSVELEQELRRLFTPEKDWTVIDAEWMKPEKKIYVFDFLKQDGRLLEDLSFAERYELLPRDYISPHISTLPVFKTVERCLAYLSSSLPTFIEGLVFRSAGSRGFSDSTIVRCRL